jgi:hypothetical protein
MLVVDYPTTAALPELPASHVNHAACLAALRGAHLSVLKPNDVCRCCCCIHTDTEIRALLNPISCDTATAAAAVAAPRLLPPVNSKGAAAAPQLLGNWATWLQGCGPHTHLHMQHHAPDRDRGRSLARGRGTQWMLGVSCPNHTQGQAAGAGVSARWTVGRKMGRCACPYCDKLLQEPCHTVLGCYDAVNLTPACSSPSSLVSQAPPLLLYPSHRSLSCAWAPGQC